MSAEIQFVSFTDDPWVDDRWPVVEEAGEIVSAEPQDMALHSLSPDEHHWLVMEEDGDEFVPYVEHPLECSFVWVQPGNPYPTHHVCGVGYEIDHVGFDEYVWGPLPQREGRWRIRHWVHVFPAGPWGGPEADTGIEWIDDPEGPGYAA